MGTFFESGKDKGNEMRVTGSGFLKLCIRYSGSLIPYSPIATTWPLGYEGLYPYFECCQFLSRLQLAEARHMQYFCGVDGSGVGDINFCQVFAFSSVL